jgi:hypothetical protein
MATAPKGRLLASAKDKPLFYFVRLKMLTAMSPNKNFHAPRLDAPLPTRQPEPNKPPLATHELHVRLIERRRRLTARAKAHLPE